MCFPAGYIFAVAIKYIVMAMLFFAFLDLEFKVRSSFYRQAIVILLTMFLLAFSLFFLLRTFDFQLALISFMLAISPTAAAAPVVIKLIRGNVEYAAYSVLTSNTIVSLCIPLIIPLIAHQEVQVSVPTLLISIATIVYLPLLSSQIIKKVLPLNITAIFLKLKSLSFYLWMILLYIVTAKSTHYIRFEAQISVFYLLKIALISFLVCLINFSTGRLLGRSKFLREASQCLGQKNTAFTIGICLQTFDPSIALGPMFYIIFQNLYNSFLIATEQRKRTQATLPP